MKKFLLLALLPFSLSAQLNISYLGRVDYNALHSTGLSNLWGYVDELGNEYAVVGTQDGISIVDVTNPAVPNEVFFISGSNTIWREVKTYNNYAYITTEANDGMKIIDLNPLPGTITPGDVYTFNGPASDPWNTEHSLFIDEATGVMFVHGTDRGNGGVILYDLNSSPTNPTEIGEFDDYYVHDSYSRGDTLYSAHITNGFFSITDVSTPSSITYMSGNQTTPMNFTHNCWLSDNGKYLFTTDEVTGAWIGAYDISDFSDIKEVDRIRRSETSGTIPHNTYWLNNYLVTSYYRDGVTIHDVTDPTNMIEVGHYDTSPMSGDGFNGAWGVYPFLPSGNLLVSDMEEGLFILGPNYVRACYLDGNVKDASTLANLNTVQVDILTTANFDQSDLAGMYSTGVATPGSYQVVYSKAGYISDTVTVNLVSATTVTENVLLQPLPTFAFTGTVTNSSTSAPLSGVQVVVENADYSYTATTDGSGNYSITPFFIDPSSNSYNIIIGQWGYETFCQMGYVIDGTNPPFNVALDPGYYDDFALDFGWTSASTAGSGYWVREEPYGTTSGFSLANPEVDVATDCSDKAFVTGNANNPSVGADDIDDGFVLLRSPLFNTTGMSDPEVSFYMWWRNTGGSGTPNDTILIYLNDGSLKLMDKLYDAVFTESSWNQRTYNLNSFTSVTTNLKIEIQAADYAPGHIAEAGVDLFRLVDGSIGVEETAAETESILVYPNPANSQLNLVSSHGNITRIEFIDVSGKVVMTLSNVNAAKTTIDINNLSKGFYSLKVWNEHGKVTLNKIIKD